MFFVYALVKLQSLATKIYHNRSFKILIDLFLLSLYMFYKFQITLLIFCRLVTEFLFPASGFASVTSYIHNWVMFLLGSILSFFLELFLHWSPVAFCTLTNLGSSSFSILSFLPFILFMVFSKQEFWSGLPLPSPVDHILLDLSTMTLRPPSWVAPQAWLGFIELDKAVVLVWLDWLVFCEYDFSLSALWCSLATPVENSERDGNTRPPDLPLEKSVCRSGSNS